MNFIELDGLVVHLAMVRRITKGYVNWDGHLFTFYIAFQYNDGQEDKFNFNDKKECEACYNFLIDDMTKNGNVKRWTRGKDYQDNEAIYRKNQDLYYKNLSNIADKKETKFSGKHFFKQLFGIDEGDAVPDAIGIDGCLSGGFRRMLIMFSPKDESGIE